MNEWRFVLYEPIPSYSLSFIAADITATVLPGVMVETLCFAKVSLSLEAASFTILDVHFASTK
jgi:hypothetical protein